ncbi:hypothetical protein NCCP2145_41240 [Pseudarthrobacter sp. NCCP-2145]|nr:hypothetical protein GCM10017547_06880 [Pseudarthrobacter oxydans]GKV74743.1 hypothetical protein NCCP2145_41240 [Pseudarthrobacter sp. NCCP-2145]
MEFWKTIYPAKNSWSTPDASSSADTPYNTLRIIVPIRLSIVVREPDVLSGGFGIMVAGADEVRKGAMPPISTGQPPLSPGQVPPGEVRPNTKVMAVRLR